YVAFLRALYLIHQHSHWCTKGDNFYGDHLLMQRLYESAAENADQAAEKAIGIFGQDSISLADQSRNIFKILSKYNNENVLENSLNAEEDFLKLSDKLYSILE